MAERPHFGVCGRQTCVGVGSGDRAFLFTSSLFDVLAKPINKRKLKRLLGFHGTLTMRGRKVWRSAFS